MRTMRTKDRGLVLIVLCPHGPHRPHRPHRPRPLSFVVASAYYLLPTDYSPKGAPIC